MFDIDKFLAGEQGIEVYNQRTFHEFRAWATRHGLTWRNGADPMSEALLDYGEYGLTTERGTHRYVGDRCNMYIMLDGHLSQRQQCYARSHNIERVNFNEVPDDTLVDADGFEVETL